MSDEKTLEKMRDDLATIKAMLWAGESKFPFGAGFFYCIGLLVAAAGLLYYFLPFYRAMTVDQLLLFFWLPFAILALCTGLFFIVARIRRRGPFAAVGPLRDFLFARFIVGPVMLFFLYLLRNDPQASSFVLLFVAGFQGMISFIMPKGFRYIPIITLTAGFLEYITGMSGPEVVMINGLFIGFQLILTGLAVPRPEKAHG